ncbi:hypothetical protein SAMN05443245_1371 [Paraburkholderia fungorum]|uniref:Uncharacterized protein n=1 Tax=Paraburkholderia fungorum TaxID=134537 RepID=A0A1H1AWT1_9BURK|nr:hypothetical protein [Paraburkholderia fungorum]SDQ43616.1 hypothetical protein SAMN05443245_1371 [Paraburkholderia fungorum]
MNVASPHNATRPDDAEALDVACALDTAVIRVDQLQALAGLLSQEEVAEQFSDLLTGVQVSIFGLFEDALADIRATLTQTVAHE